MHYAPGIEKCPLNFSPFKSCTVPRPIGWISTVSEKGIPNLAPFSQWQNLTFDPPMVMFAANHLSSGKLIFSFFKIRGLNISSFLLLIFKRCGRLPKEI